MIIVDGLEARRCTKLWGQPFEAAAGLPPGAGRVDLISRNAGRKPGGSLERLTLLVLSLALAGCTRTVHTISYSPPSNVRTTMQRQVEHAVYAGEGDPEIRSLRLRLAANANDLDARIMLARLYAQRNLPDLALEHYRFASAQFPDSVIAALGVAATLQQMGATREALQFLNSRPNQSWELLAM